MFNSLFVVKIGECKTLYDAFINLICTFDIFYPKPLLDLQFLI